MVTTEAKAPAFEQPDERTFFSELRDEHASFVPVVGSGMSKAAGAPGFPALIEHLITQAAAMTANLTVSAPDPPFDVVDAIAAELGEEWVQQQTADYYRECELATTPALQALSKVASGLIITTNYDLSVEVAARSIGMVAESLTLDRFDIAMKSDSGALRVLHLHGVCTLPGTIVLTNDSYARILASEQSRLLLRALGTTHRFVFLGHSLDVREEHIRRDLAWTMDAASSARKPHLLITNASATDPQATEFKAELENSARIEVVQFADPKKEYQAAVRAAHAIARPPVVETADQAPLIDPAELDANYLPLPMAEASLVSEAGGLGAYTAKIWQEGQILSTDLDDAELHIVIEAEGGAGKSQELLQIAHRSTKPALVQHVVNIQIDPGWTDAGPRFVAGMASARATRVGVPKLTLEGLRDASYTLLLDGLDEVPAANRPRLLQLLAEIARTYPQHRIVIASRPLPELTDQETFVRWTPMTDMAWVTRYAETRGVSEPQLLEALPHTGDVSDLIVIPIYAAAAVSRVYAGTPLPSTALELVCDLADRRLGIDTRIQAAPETVRVWLDRLALALQRCGISELRVDELVNSGLHADLDQLEPTQETLGELAARALLRDSAGVIRFPANVMKEARAARALLDAGERGLEILRHHVLIELEVRDLEGQPVRAVHPAWVNVLELLLPAADDRWREEIVPFDPCLVARATGPAATSEQRAWAVHLLWKTYVARRVWLERRASVGNGSSDGDALVRLVSLEVPVGFDDTLRAATTAEERTVRGNALELVPHVLPRDEALQLLVTAVRDEDDVVRRRAAAAGWTMAALYPDLLSDSTLMENYVEAMADQAVSDTDKMAAETLIGVAVDLAQEGRAVEIALSSTGKLRRHAVMSLARRVTRSRLLALLRSAESVDGDLLDELVEDRTLGRRQPWASPDIAELAHIVAERHDDTYWHHDAQDVLAEQPVVAFQAFLDHPVGEELRYELGGRLVMAMDEPQIERLLGVLNSRDSEHLGDLDVPIDPSTWDADTVEVAIELLSGTLNARRNPPAFPSTRRVRTQHEDGGKPETASEVSDDELRSAFEDEGVARAFNPETKAVSQRLWLILRAGAEREFTLDAEKAGQLFRFLLDWSDAELEAWLADQWSEAARERIEAVIAEMDARHLPRLAELLPGPWAPDLGERVLQAVATSDERSGRKSSLALAVGERMGEDPLRDSLRDHHGTVWADTVLLRLGDCAAEARMITRQAAAPASIRRHPNAYDEEWFSSIRCPESASSLADLIKAALQEGVSTNELEPLCRALDRTAGPRSLRIWERLSRDPEIPSASFLYYERRVALAAQLEQHSPPAAITDEELTRRVVDAVRLTHHR
ncbi:SIR2 family NAD-dependent protein deacylase [Nocardioides campestrisoli]|uniref:SIR2 family NAD-dependent protein deacylase n=1 Tax=Nocardioides campestrisoli TaxID=2736757 RepID=UPI00163D72B7|nr:SIR2 family protein [Nocardioides campestrisoli]